MRLLILTHEYPPIGGGGGAAARDISLGLAKRGFEIKIITAHIDGLPLREIQDGIEIIRVPSLRRERFRARLPEMGAFIFAGLWAAIRLMRSWRPDLIHAHFAVPAGALAWMLSRLYRLPYVLTAHLGDVPGGVPEKTGKWFRFILPFTHPIWRAAAKVVAVSNFTRGLAVRHYARPIEVIPNGVDLTPLRPHPIKVQEPMRIVFAGRFVEQKNPLQLVRVLGRLKDLHWQCAMLGDGPLFDAVRTEIAHLQIQDRFHLPGWVTPETVLDEFRRADILFMPSRSEGLPVVGVQALACGLAIVAGQVGGFVDLVEPGANGYLHESDDADGMAASLRALLSSAAELNRARVHSLQLAQTFDIQRVVSAYEHLFLNEVFNEK